MQVILSQAYYHSRIDHQRVVYGSLPNIDEAVIETGLGGRLDSTNIIDLVLSVNTNIGLDHTRFLGHTLPEIAGEKAGIIKAGRPVIISEKQPETSPVFEKKARNEGSPLYYAGDYYHIPNATLTMERQQQFYVNSGDKAVYEGLTFQLTGTYQRKNIPAVLLATDLLREPGFGISGEAVYNGIGRVKTLTGLPGRWEEIGHNQLIVCDVTI